MTVILIMLLLCCIELFGAYTVMKDTGKSESMYDIESPHEFFHMD
ncbi:hypothetical protein P6P90_11010 [Ectobacillus antri]|jgi:hypothetical protein|uniref:Uncharacterized protein n=1 Tax=Ectobacillus antri TaxID=2486280 RepID=A0ABT6H797_9BACI|nr:hypothetical protein [Ectobacillus antri]MDG4657372.1 hypothetical protein [Ectobacillus antri]MDG5754497.1 hypothetical protein [Ectobacillus antri]